MEYRFKIITIIDPLLAHYRPRVSKGYKDLGCSPPRLPTLHVFKNVMENSQASSFPHDVFLHRYSFFKPLQFLENEQTSRNFKDECRRSDSVYPKGSTLPLLKNTPDKLNSKPFEYSRCKMDLMVFPSFKQRLISRYAMHNDNVTF
ncbi:jg17051 [Pararge aegeria aegeria]|uniref:Jg17051 protein n=1 Tax=Pararge aegeria aegeria TaxID=348720 RepID=A0A8S4R6H8_9NEOP|nr:jg17051 [Pararge aegeria aegeria]